MGNIPSNQVKASQYWKGIESSKQPLQITTIKHDNKIVVDCLNSNQTN
jgi:hypothetical protein